MDAAPLPLQDYLGPDVTGRGPFTGGDMNPRIPLAYLGAVTLLLHAAPPCPALPVAFDLRNVDGECFVTSIKSQDGGTCWAHGTMAAIEGNLLMTGAWEASGEEGEPNLAEYHLDWWNGFNDNWNGDLDPVYGRGLTVHQGGDYRVASAYLSRGDGAVRDVDGQSFIVPPLQYSPDYHLFYPRHIEWYTAGRDLERIDAIKAALMEYGVMGTCMCYSYQFIESLIHYQPPSSDELPNHAIAIIGWNDTLRTQAPEPGAWLCKNSWGEEWGMDGCFWISYHDRWAGHEPQMGAVSFREVEPMRYDKVLYHDLHGWRDTMAEATEAMNAFAVESPTLISSGGFFTASDSTAWRLSVYSGFDGYEPCELLASDSGMFVRTGYHTVDFPEPFEAMKGDSLFVVLLLDRGGQPYDRTSEVPVLLGAKYRTIVESTASAGESYYRDGSGTWVDLQDWAGNPYPGTGNFCIKLLGRGSGLRVIPGGPIVIEGPCGGPFDPTAFSLELTAFSAEDLFFTIGVEPSVDWLSVTGPALGVARPGETVQACFEINANASLLPGGAYAAAILVNDRSSGETIRIPVELMIGGAVTVYSWDMSSDPGWDMEPLWAWGEPQGGGGEHGNPDPVSGATGSFVLGYNLDGDYENLLPETYLTTGAIDCSALRGVSLRFMRWLGVQIRGFDHASLLVSTDMSRWTTVWSNAEVPGDLTDSQWVEVEYDISGIADGESTVYLRWVMGPTNDGWRYCGWNIDDVEIRGLLNAGAGGVLPPSLELGAAVPNPSAGTVSVILALPASGYAAVEVYDLAGRLVRTLADGWLLQGDHEIVWDGLSGSGAAASPGVYFIRARRGTSDAVSKVVLLPGL